MLTFRYQEVFDKLKDAYQVANRSKKLQILSLSPYGFEETKSFFGATNHMVSLSRNLTKEQGVLPEIPLISKGKCLTKEDKHFVARFFEEIHKAKGTKSEVF